MTDATELAQLSAAAPKGEWRLTQDACGDLFVCSDDCGVILEICATEDDHDAAATFAVALVNAYRTNQLVERDAVAGVDVETIARIIDPSSWQVMDSELARLKRKPGWENIGWPAGQFQHKESMAKARQIIATLVKPERINRAALAYLIADTADHPEPNYKDAGNAQG